MRTGNNLVPKHTAVFIYYFFTGHNKIHLQSVAYCTIIYHIHCHHFVQVSALSGPLSGRKWVQDMCNMNILLLGNVALPHRKHSFLFTLIVFYLLT